MKKLVLNMGRCRKCKRVLISVSVHDFRSCECGSFVDGGHDYMRRGGDIEDFSVFLEDGKLGFYSDHRETSHEMASS